MNAELRKLEQILKDFPMDVYTAPELKEHALSDINIEDASLIWKYAQQYLSIAKEVDIVK